MERLRSHATTLAFFGITVVWGATFALIKRSLDDISPFWFMALRFGLAFCITAPAVLLRGNLPSRSEVRAGVVLGVLLYVSYALQTFGLQRTLASNAALITGMFVVFIPLLSVVMLNKRPDGRAMLGAAVALAGLAILTIQPHTRVGAGDALLLSSTIFLSLYVIAMDVYAPAMDLLAITAVQMGVLTAGVTLSGLATETPVLPAVNFVWLSVAVCGIFGSALAFWVQGYAQRELPPARIAVILIMEPVFGVIFSLIIPNERLSARGWTGCALILTGLLVSELRGRN